MGLLISDLHLIFTLLRKEVITKLLIRLFEVFGGDTFRYRYPNGGLVEYTVILMRYIPRQWSFLTHIFLTTVTAGSSVKWRATTCDMVISV